MTMKRRLAPDDATEARWRREDEEIEAWERLFSEPPLPSPLPAYDLPDEKIERLTDEIAFYEDRLRYDELGEVS